MEITHHTKKQKELKLKKEKKKTINRCQYQEDTDAGVIWLRFSRSHHKMASMNNYEHA